MSFDNLFPTGRVVDLVLLVVVAEFAFLSWRGLRRLSHTSSIDLLFALAPGVCLLMALRSALTGASWPWVALWLAASFPIHIGDLMRRRL